MNKKMIVALLIIGIASLVILSKKTSPIPSVEKPLSYHNTSYGLSFEYPSLYYLQEKEAGDEQRPGVSVVLVEDTEENRDLLNGIASEPRDGPTSITVEVYQNPQRLSPEDWKREHTNWATISKIADTTVAGMPAVSYAVDGLYAGKITVVTNDTLAYVFSVGWISSEDRIVSDYESVLASVTLGK